ncbi:MAG: hypothetical protein OEY03_04530 [Rhizobacter sp.]|nr:hypothetical protein [Rhizobacter sp.]
MQRGAVGRRNGAKLIVLSNCAAPDMRRDDIDALMLYCSRLASVDSIDSNRSALT